MCKRDDGGQGVQVSVCGMAKSTTEHENRIGGQAGRQADVMGDVWSRRRRLAEWEGGIGWGPESEKGKEGEGEGKGKGRGKGKGKEKSKAASSQVNLPSRCSAVR